MSPTTTRDAIAVQATRLAVGRTARRRTIAGAVVVVFLVIFWLQFSSPGVCCRDYDGYYHIGWSQRLWTGLRQGDFPPAFTWLSLTALNARDYADQQLLYHLLLVPFTWIGEPRFGIKLATALFSGFALCSVLWVLLRYRIRYPLLWLLFLLGSSWLFLFRLELARANGLSLVLLVISVVLLFEKKYVWLAAAAFLYVWTYNLFVLLWVAAIIWTAVLWWQKRRWEWRPLFWSCLGTVAGLVVNPYFPHDLSLLLLHLRMLFSPSNLVRGNEWYPLDSWALLKGTAGAALAMVVGWISYGCLLGQNRDNRQPADRILFLLLFSGFLLGITLHGRRFVEYWAPFAVLFAAFATQPLLDSASRLAAGKIRFREWAGFGAALALLVAYSLFATRQNIHSQPDLSKNDDLIEAAAWMRDHIPVGTPIFNVAWADFPKLFYYDPTHTYISGLDPDYLYFEDPSLCEAYMRISTGEEPDPASVIRDRFSADYVFVGAIAFTDSRIKRFLEVADRSGKFITVFRGPTTLVLRVNP